ncbi:hypothetical protein FACS189491_06110 [Spirochaetia bacterium]|nr:hypothetical protein FACS189491_06110 [Spirochaetia bacterium]
MMEYDNMFWEYLEKLLKENEVVIDRPKGSSHPKFCDKIYPTDYGYIKNTKSMDGAGIDVFIGTINKKSVDAILCNIDLYRNDSEIKILIGCTEDEKNEIYNFMNNWETMKAIMIRRDN